MKNCSGNQFKLEKNEFTEEMTMEAFLQEAENNSTKVIIVFKNIPLEIDPKDNEVGTKQSLEKLRKYYKQSKTRKNEQ
mgnify:CR=1 FL=1